MLVSVIYIMYITYTIHEHMHVDMCNIIIAAYTYNACTV